VIQETKSQCKSNDTILKQTLNSQCLNCVCYTDIKVAVSMYHISHHYMFFVHLVPTVTINLSTWVFPKVGPCFPLILWTPIPLLLVKNDVMATRF